MILITFGGKNSVLSNFHACEFSEGDLFFNCVEQYYSYHKATFFEVDLAKKQIMEFTDPVQMKRIKIKGFTQDEWKHISTKVMQRAIALKMHSKP